MTSPPASRFPLPPYRYTPPICAIEGSNLTVGMVMVSPLDRSTRGHWVRITDLKADGRRSLLVCAKDVKTGASEKFFLLRCAQALVSRKSIPSEQVQALRLLSAGA